ncbi:MAG: sigma-54 dependent transcriptional regulator [Chlamydiota bacterium]
METILIVEDNPGIRNLLSASIQMDGYATAVTDVEDTALDLVRKLVPKLVLLDILLPAANGMELLKKMRRIDRDLSIIMMTGHGDIGQAVQAIKHGAVDYITKPFNIPELLSLIRNTLHNRSSSKDLEHLGHSSLSKTTVEKLMGTSPQIRCVLDQVKMSAPTDMTVLIQGDSGTGKELITNLIVRASTRAAKPFVTVDCGAISNTLFDGEFFGYEKGAFTGADSAREGKFEQANGGTILLDEIENLPEGTQMKLLRVLEEKKINRLGSKRAIDVDVRVIVAANIDLAEEVKQRRFRKDLYHRLNHFTIVLPPLRDRREDIPALSRHFMEKAAEEFGKPIHDFTLEAMRCLMEYDWPGNVRELKNVIRRAVLIAHPGSITVSDLSLDITDPKNAEEAPASGSNGTEVLGGRKKGRVLKNMLEDVEKDILKNALDQSGGSRVKAAAILGLNRKALYRKIKSLGLSS